MTNTKGTKPMRARRTKADSTDSPTAWKVQLSREAAASLLQLLGNVEVLCWMIQEDSKELLAKLREELGLA